MPTADPQRASARGAAPGTGATRGRHDLHIAGEATDPPDIDGIPGTDYEALFDQSPAAALMIRHGVVLDANRNAVMVFGLAQRGELLGHEFLEFVAPRERATFDDRVAGRWADDAAPRTHETVGLRADGTEFPMETLFGRIALADRHAVLVYVSDLTDRKARDADRAQMEAQARQSAKMEAVGQLAGGVAHDFNNLMTVVLGYTDLLQQDPALPSAAHDDLVAIGDAARRAAVLTRQLLTFSRQAVLRPRVVPIDEIVRPVVPMLRRLLGEEIQFDYIPNDASGAVLADPSQVEQIVMNLAINARDAMPVGGRLTISTSEVHLETPYVDTHAGVAPGHYVVLSVSDTGTGMDEATRSRIFEPFFTTKAVGRGTGLGLATVYGIVQQAGGYIWLYSEVGLGSVFKVYLPRVSPGPTGAELESPADRAAAAAAVARTILLVEDEAAVRALMKTVLVRLGHRVLDAGNPADAMRIAESGSLHIHLLLTDVVMPGMTGPELARQMLATRPELRVMFASGYTERAVTPEDLAHPGVTFLAKPFTADELAHAVRAAIAGLEVNHSN